MGQDTQFKLKKGNLSVEQMKALGTLSHPFLHSAPRYKRPRPHLPMHRALSFPLLAASLLAHGNSLSRSRRRRHMWMSAF